MAHSGTKDTPVAVMRCEEDRLAAIACVRVDLVAGRGKDLGSRVDDQAAGESIGDLKLDWHPLGDRVFGPGNSNVREVHRQVRDSWR